MGNNKKYILIGVSVVILLMVAYFVGQSSNNQTQSTNTPTANNASAQSTPTPVAQNTNPSGYQAPYSGMATACQQIADYWLRSDLIEFVAGTQSPTGSDNIYYNSSKSICYFTDDVTHYPQVYSILDPTSVETLYLRAVAMSPDGVGQKVVNGSVMGVALPVAYCTLSAYSKGSPETHCVTFNLIQTGAGTDSYTANALGIGDDISQPEYQSLVSQDMSAN